MTKRTAAEDAARPLCKCHGEPMIRNSRQRNGDIKWACKHKRRGYAQHQYHECGGREQKRAQYEQRIADGVCVKCRGPLLTDRLCWDCLNYLEEAAFNRVGLGR